MNIMGLYMSGNEGWGVTDDDELVLGLLPDDPGLDLLLAGDADDELFSFFSSLLLLVCGCGT